MAILLIGYVASMINLVKIISTAIDDAGRRLPKFLRYGKSDVQTSIQAAAWGVDAVPAKDAIAVYAETGVKGKTIILGYLNKNALAAIGENRLFSTDADGAVKFAIHLKNDGTCEIGGNADNMVRYSELETAFNQLKSEHDDLVNAFNTHMHATAAPGPPSSPTPGSGIPAMPSTADITPAKIDEIKTM